MMERSRNRVIDVPIDVVTWRLAVQRIGRWALSGESRVVCICNAHSVVSARTNHEFGEIIATSDMATPDGAPVAWLMRRHGYRAQKRINGPDLMLRQCEHAAKSGYSIYLYGATEVTLDRLEARLRELFPRLRIAGRKAPPFRALTAEEDRQVVQDINASGAGVVWVSLGCPKQERWAYEHRGRVNAVMIGVGAAFDYHAGSLRRAPAWMREHGLEWLFRLVMEPRRLWKRYLLTNTKFLWFATRDALHFGVSDRL